MGTTLQRARRGSWRPTAPRQVTGKPTDDADGNGSTWRAFDASVRSIVTAAPAAAPFGRLSSFATRVAMCVAHRFISSAEYRVVTDRCSGYEAQHRADTQQPTRAGNRIVRLVIAHEPEPFGGIVFVSRANQAAAFERISRSSFSWRFSRRSRLSSSRSAVVSPPSPRPASRADCAIQFLIDCAVGSNSHASSSGERQVRTSSTHLATELRRVG